MRGAGPGRQKAASQQLSNQRVSSPPSRGDDSAATPWAFRSSAEKSWGPRSQAIHCRSSPLARPEFKNLPECIPFIIKYLIHGNGEHYNSPTSIAEFSMSPVPGGGRPLVTHTYY